MKEGEEATRQFDELAHALVEIGAGWVVDEVNELTARGQSVPLSSLGNAEYEEFSTRLAREREKGLAVGRLSKSDEVTVAYSPAERLALLVDAAKRVVVATVRSHRYVTSFAADNDLDVVRFTEPVGVDDSTSSPDVREVAMADEPNSEEQLEAVRSLLSDEVLQA